MACYGTVLLLRNALWAKPVSHQCCANINRTVKLQPRSAQTKPPIHPKQGCLTKSNSTTHGNTVRDPVLMVAPQGSSIVMLSVRLVKHNRSSDVEGCSCTRWKLGEPLLAQQVLAWCWRWYALVDAHTELNYKRVSSDAR